MNQNRPFRFGVLMHNWGTRQEWIDKARRIEAQGFSTLLVPDHLDGQFGAIPALAAAAAATTTVRLGSIVFANDFRHPVLLAKDVATLDLLSDGRFELGLGAGWKRDEFERAGIPFDPAPVRLDRLEESLHVLKALFADGPVSYAGRYYTVSELDGGPKPIQRPRPPLLVGGGGERILSLAAREADIVSIGVRTRPDGNHDWRSATEEAVAAKLSWIREAAGDRFSGLELNVMIYGLAVTDDRRGAAGRTAEHRSGLTEDEVLDSPHFLIGSVDQIGDDLRRRRERYGISYVIVPEVFVDAVAPVVERLAGT
jgi:probable F420-dependent oxidoreductase